MYVNNKYLIKYIASALGSFPIADSWIPGIYTTQIPPIPKWMGGDVHRGTSIMNREVMR